MTKDFVKVLDSKDFSINVFWTALSCNLLVSACALLTMNCQINLAWDGWVLLDLIWIDINLFICLIFRSAYLLYYYDIYLKVQQELPHLPQSEINKKISESWRLLSVAEKSYYLEKAKLEKEGLDPVIFLTTVTSFWTFSGLQISKFIDVVHWKAP